MISEFLLVIAAYNDDGSPIWWQELLAMKIGLRSVSISISSLTIGRFGRLQLPRPGSSKSGPAGNLAAMREQRFRRRNGWESAIRWESKIRIVLEVGNPLEVEDQHVFAGKMG